MAGTIRDGSYGLRQGWEDAQKLKALRIKIKAGVDALDRGDFIEIDEADLDDYLERLTV